MSSADKTWMMKNITKQLTLLSHCHEKYGAFLNNYMNQLTNNYLVHKSNILVKSCKKVLTLSCLKVDSIFNSL